MVAHFWIGESSGMVWGALLVVATLLLVAWRLVAALRGARIGAGVKLHYWLAFVNVGAAATLGILLGLNRLRPFLRLAPLDGLFAHAHLAAMGWAMMTVFGSAYRLLPMTLPAAPPPAGSAWASALLLEVGVIALVVGFLGGRGATRFGAVLAAASVAWFLGVVSWLVRHRRRPGPGIRVSTSRGCTCWRRCSTSLRPLPSGWCSRSARAPRTLSAWPRCMESAVCSGSSAP